jgi:hypothetical protein
MSLLASGNSDWILFLEEKATGRGMSFGRLDVRTLRRTVTLELTNEVAADSFFAYEPSGRFFCVAEKRQGSPHLTLYQPGREVSSIPWQPANTEFGIGAISSDGKWIVAPYIEHDPATKGDELGIAEISPEGKPMRKTALLHKGTSGSEAKSFFQVSVSHDGKTAAVSTTYLFDEEKLKGEDCGLFLVDLSRANRPVTRVRMPPPPGAAPVVK